MIKLSCRARRNWLALRRSALRRGAAALLAVMITMLALPVGAVQAHAQLLGSNPAPGQTVASFPKTAELTFSEILDINSARARLYNASGELVGEGKPRGDPARPRVLLVDLPTQPDGVYSLDWRVVSAVDGHDTTGTIAFSVGLSSPQASMLPPPGAPDPAADLPPAAEAIFRWIAYIGVALVLGGALFALLVWRPAYQAAAGELARSGLLAGGEARAAELEAWDAWATGLLKGLILFGAIGVFFSMAGVLIYESLLLTPEQTAPVWQSLLTEFGHDEGSLVWLRVLALALAAVLSTLLPRINVSSGSAGAHTAVGESPSEGGRTSGSARSAGEPPGVGRSGVRLWWVIIGLGMLAVLSYSLTGHNAGLGSPLPVIGDWLHFSGASAWLGGLVPLGALLWRGRVLAAESAGSAPVESGALLNRVSQRFSRLALVSVVVLALTGLYSGLLQVQSLPALLGARYGQAILVKSGLFLVLIALGALNQRAILPRIAGIGQRALRWLGRSVRVEIALGALLLLAVGVLMSLSPANDALLASRRQGLHERWQGDGVSIDFRAAPMQVGDNEFGVDIVDRRPGAEQAVGTVLLRIQPVNGGAGPVQVEAKLTGPRRYTARGTYLSRMGAWDVLVIWRKPRFNDVTHVFTVDLVQWAIDNGDEVNPVTPDSSSIEDGRALYAGNCAPCHGATGKGDGPSGRVLNPAPSDLTQHAVVGVHSDGQLFDWISGGFPGSAMPAFKGQLTEKQRWDLVNFIRTLAK